MAKDINVPATLSEKVSILNQRQIEMFELMNKMNLCLVGDEDLGIRGMVKVVNEHSAAIKEYKSDRSKIIGFGIGSGVASGGFFAWLSKLFF